ncbi:MAG: S24/S26 family peptidase [Paludibacteraceae bacterium]|nr:S24/S26 family peptidase [Paludibacteraceae bacterium]
MSHLVANAVLIPEIATLIRDGHTVSFTPSGVSMRPFIEGGKDSVVLGKPVDVRVGDIVLAQIGQDSYVLHRLIAVQGNTLTLMGDGNLFGGEHCDKVDVLAKVLEIRSPKGHKKPLSRGYLWRIALPLRKWLLKIYRHTPRWL